MEEMVKAPFGAVPGEGAAERITLEAGPLSCDILTYGGILQALRVPDRRGEPVDIVLGFDTLEAYRQQDKYIGALVGRCANRIAGGRFSLDGAAYALAINNGPNHLHGGLRGFDRQIWTVEDAGRRYVTLSLRSPDGQEGYPGNLDVRVTYTLSEEGLTLDYLAQCDQATPCNLTNHTYFNLAGHNSGPVLDQTIQLLADRYTPADEVSIPTGAVEDVAGTPMDLRQPVIIGLHMQENFPQLRMAGGCDHNWVINGEAGTLRPAARAFCEATGISLELLTTLPGVQFYTGNYLDGCPAGKGGAAYDRHGGFCLETQFYPDTPNHPSFPSCILRPGETWHHTTAFRFGRG